MRRGLLILLGAVGVLLLIACTNIASLMLAKSEIRKREFGIRAAIGAGRGSIIRQLLTETLVLGLIGGAAGLLVATWVLQALVRFQPPIPFPMNLEFGLDGTVLLFTGLIFFVRRRD